jgi:hypothetical protein
MPADASRTWVSTAGQSRSSGDRNISITMRLDAVTTPMLLKAEHSGWMRGLCGCPEGAYILHREISRFKESW